ncbi:ATP-binding cassette domain-containing protein [Bifidobacterium sp. ESL0763]|uniref:ATP-binding cassette domain-containing protein n=1 Tax=Bifidobacterium sp. ESL0763 TaxID=2983227 RepID=UPI0023F6B7DA|nr:ATP-binding cassette domain-containing protein [Bifidobacterium sp. ESL0763]MDF7663713.1 ATP-binding cassette domain-containing protein [Bifidobacterium sp. ESL0763]
MQSTAPARGVTAGPGDARPGGSVPRSVRFEGWGYRHASREQFTLSGLDLDIAAGQRVLLLGASGIGKSTLLEATAGLIGTGVNTTDAADGETAGAYEDEDGGVGAGRILIGGVPVRQARGEVGLVLQDPDAQAVFERLGDNVAFGPENMAMPPERIWPCVRRALGEVGLGGLQLHRMVTHLSGGQLQRLALAGALAMNPGVLLLDEPTANLDPVGVGQIVGAVGQVLERNHSTMILVEHRVDEWIDLIDRVVLLGRRDGDGAARIEADGAPEEVFADPSIDFDELGVWVPKRYRRHARKSARFPALEPEPDPGHSEDSKPTVLSTRRLSIGRASKAIASGIDLEFHAGEITALVGRNGAGKSTLSLTLAGLLAPVCGEVVAGESLCRGVEGSSPIAWPSSKLASRISYVFQNPEHQFARGTVLDEVMLGPLKAGIPEEEAQARANDLLERFGLRRYAGVNPYTLSGGEKRRLTVASALASAPRVLILDEPTFGQDRRTWLQMVELIAGLRGQGICVIVVTHDRDLVRALKARVIELRAEGDGGSDGPERNGGTGTFDTVDDIDNLRDADRDTDVVENTETADGPVSVDDGVHATDGADDVNDADDAGRVDDAPVNRQSKQNRSRHPGQTIGVSAIDRRQEARRPSSASPWLATLNPSFRFIGGLLVALPLLLSLDWVSAGVALALEFLLLALLGISPWRVVRSTWPVFVGAPGSALAVVLYGKEGGTLWWHWGLMTVTDRSLLLALATALRVLAIGVPAIIAVIGIDATDLADSFSQILHLPDRFVYGGLAGMRLFSVLRDDWAALTASRRSRGLGDENRVKAFFPQTFALLVLSIRRSTMLATAMEARGFGSDAPRTHARVSRVRPRDWAFLVACLLVPALSLSVSLLAGTFAFFGG